MSLFSLWRSHPVWLCDPVCGLLPSGSGLGSGQQPVWDSRRRLENHHSVPPGRARESPGYRGLAAHSARRRHISRSNKCELLLLTVSGWIESNLSPHSLLLCTCLSRPWSLPSHRTWFHGWCTTGLSLCTRMEITLQTPWRATSTARCLCSTPGTSPTLAGLWASLPTSPPAGDKRSQSVGAAWEQVALNTVKYCVEWWNILTSSVHILHMGLKTFVL